MSVSPNQCEEQLSRTELLNDCFVIVCVQPWTVDVQTHNNMSIFGLINTKCNCCGTFVSYYESFQYISVKLHLKSLRPLALFRPAANGSSAVATVTRALSWIAIVLLLTTNGSVGILVVIMLAMDTSISQYTFRYRIISITKCFIYVYIQI